MPCPFRSFCHDDSGRPGRRRYQDRTSGPGRPLPQERPFHRRLQRILPKHESWQARSHTGLTKRQRQGDIPEIGGGGRRSGTELSSRLHEAPGPRLSGTPSTEPPYHIRIDFRLWPDRSLRYQDCLRHYRAGYGWHAQRDRRAGRPSHQARCFAGRHGMQPL